MSAPLPFMFSGDGCDVMDGVVFVFFMVAVSCLDGA